MTALTPFGAFSCKAAICLDFWGTGRRLHPVSQQTLVRAGSGFPVLLTSRLPFERPGMLELALSSRDTAKQYPFFFEVPGFEEKNTYITPDYDVPMVRG